jgi:hypothetical protein
MGCNKAVMLGLGKKLRQNSRGLLPENGDACQLKSPREERIRNLPESEDMLRPASKTEVSPAQNITVPASRHCVGRGTLEATLAARCEVLGCRSAKTESPRLEAMWGQKLNSATFPLRRSFNCKTVECAR